MIRWVSFSALMVRRILAGAKDETRRVGPARWSTGDELHVLEPIRRTLDGGTVYTADETTALADGGALTWRWKPSGLPGRYMPRGLSRLVVEVEDVHEEQLQDITDAAILREGVTVEIARVIAPRARIESLRDAWIVGWDKISGHRAGCAWRDNPRVTVTRFRRVRP